MRRKDKEVRDKRDIDSIICQAKVCRLGMSDGARPYVVPLCFGYQNNRLYFHSAAEGTKVDILRKNKNVCVEFDVDAEVVRVKMPAFGA